MEGWQEIDQGGSGPHLYHAHCMTWVNPVSVVKLLVFICKLVEREDPHRAVVGTERWRVKCDQGFKSQHFLCQVASLQGRSCSGPLVVCDLFCASWRCLCHCVKVSVTSWDDWCSQLNSLRAFILHTHTHTQPTANKLSWLKWISRL